MVYNRKKFRNIYQIYHVGRHSSVNTQINDYPGALDKAIHKCRILTLVYYFNLLFDGWEIIKIVTLGGSECFKIYLHHLTLNFIYNQKTNDVKVELKEAKNNLYSEINR